MQNQKEYTKKNIVSFVASEIMTKFEDGTLVSSSDLEAYNMSFPMGVCDMFDPDSLVSDCLETIKYDFEYSEDKQDEIKEIVKSTASAVIPRELYN
jgi:hypothetical protein